MELTCLFVLFLLCGLSRQAPKQLTRRGNTSVIMDEHKKENQPNPLSTNIGNLFTNRLIHRRQKVIDLVRNITPSSGAKIERKLEKHSTIAKIPEISQLEHTSENVRDDIDISDIKMAGKYENKQKNSKYVIGGSGDNSSSEDGMSNNSNLDEDPSGDEDTQDMTDELKISSTSGDSVAAFIKTDSVSGTTRDVITDKMSDERDPVASYTTWNSNQGRKGNLRDIIEGDEEEDYRATTDSTYPDEKSSSSAMYSNPRDPVASYITAAASEVKDKISAVESKMDTDSVSPYIDELGSSYKNNILMNKNHDENKRAEGSAAIFQVSGRTKDAKSRKLEQEDSEKEILKNEINDNTEASGSGEAVDDDGDDNVLSKTFAGDNSAEDEASGEDNFHSSKTQTILEGLEEDLSQENSSQIQSQENLTYRGGQNDDLWRHKSNLKKTQEKPSSYIVQQPYGVPIQYNVMPQYTIPQYMYVSIKDAEKKGAVCLDGSSPGYFYRRGTGNGERRWIIYLQGGAWCDSKEDCYERSKSNLGSSLKFTYLHNAEGLLSRDEAKNPDFYNWNAVYVPYCDGASYTGNRSHPVVVKGRMIYFRGKRILSTLLDDLLVHGLSHSEKVVFSGTSAGGLAVLLNADYVRSRIPTKVNVYSLADAGVFLDVKNMIGKSPFADTMKAVYKLHQSSGAINSKCKTQQGKNDEWKCLFPFYFGEYIQTPLFIVNPLHDSWQLANVVGIHCAYKPDKCDEREMKAVKTFREQTLKALNPFMKNPHVGIFADGCVDHGQIVFSPKWTKIRVKNRSMSGTFVRWMKREENVKSVIDVQMDQYPFNPTCVSHFHD